MLKVCLYVLSLCLALYLVVDDVVGLNVGLPLGLVLDISVWGSVCLAIDWVICLAWVSMLLVSSGNQCFVFKIVIPSF